MRDLERSKKFVSSHGFLYHLLPVKNWAVRQLRVMVSTLGVIKTFFFNTADLKLSGYFKHHLTFWVTNFIRIIHTK